jgi:predicted dehydrogenase
MLQCGIIGCGRICPNHFVTMNEHPDVNVKWLCDLDVDKTNAFHKQAPEARQTYLAADVLEDPEVDFVHVLTDHAAHFTVAMSALMVGKHVIVEKPFTLNVEQAQKLVDTAKEKNLHLICISQHRFDPMINRIRKIVTDGKIGKLLLINGRLLCGRNEEYYSDSYWHGRKALDGGSALINQGYHIFDIILSMGGNPKTINAFADRRKYPTLIETEDTISIQYTLASGAIGSLNITSGLVREEWDAKVEIIGTEGRILFDLESPHQVPVLDIPGIQASDLLQMVDREHNTIGIDYYGDLHDIQLKDFIEGLKNNQEPFFDPQNAVLTLDAILQAYHSAEENGYEWGNLY